MKNLFCALALMAILMPSTLYAQSDKTISGTVTDRQTGKPLPYAHVFLQGTSVLTVTSAEGTFLLHIPSDIKGGILEVSTLGYTNYQIKISKASSKLDIKLEPGVKILEAVDVSVSTPEKLISSAVRRVPNNYFQEQALLRGFYRETGTINDQYGHIGEAVVNIQKGPYKGKLTGGWDDVAMVKGREVGTKDTLAMEIWKSHPFAIQGGIYNTVNHDIAKHAHSLQYPFIRKDHFSQYEYELKGKSKFEDREVYVITFDQKERINQALFQGEILIDTESLAFVRIEYKLSDAHLKDVPITRVKGVDLHKTEHYGEVQYRMLDGKWYLSYSQEGEAFRADAHSDKMKAVYQETFGTDYMETARSFELVVTYMQYGEGLQPLDKDKLLGYRDALMDMEAEYDEDYWKGYNSVIIGKSLLESFRK